jgi:dihydroorotate dehydrogenase electron transfer subunit
MYFTGEIKENRLISEDCFLMRIHTPYLAPFVPGQFLMVRGWRGTDPLLPRPFAIYAWGVEGKGGALEIVYKVSGRGTKILSGLHIGDLLYLNGPLGNGFTPPEGTKEIILVGGGVGFSSVLPIALEMRKGSIPMRVFLGARTAGHIPSIDNIGARILTDSFSYATEDGTMGFKGLVTELLESKLREEEEVDRGDMVVFACGPHDMLKRVQGLLHEMKIEGYLSLENFMACGFGVCLGCVVRIRDGEGYKHLRVCLEGPVFPSEEVLFDG